MRKRFYSISLIGFLAIFVPFLGMSQGVKPLPVDARIKTGTLPNGFTYYIRANNMPKGQTHYLLVQKPVKEPFFHCVADTANSYKDGLAQMYRALREQRVYTPNKYRPHLQGVFVVGDVVPDSVEVWLKKQWADLPASVDVLQAQEVPTDPGNRVAGKVFSSKPLPPVLQDGFSTVRMGYPLPLLSRDQRASAEYFVMQFFRYVVQYALRQEVPQATTYYSGDSLFVEMKSSPESTGTTFFDLVRQATPVIRKGISPAQLAQAKTLFLAEAGWEFQNSTVYSNAVHIDNCIQHFLTGMPLPSATWQYQFYTRMIPFVSLQHVNQYVQGTLTYHTPRMEVRQPAVQADSLCVENTVDQQTLQLERDRVAARLNQLLFPFDESEFMELTIQLTNIDLRLYLDSLVHATVIRIPNADSLSLLYKKALSQPAPQSAVRVDSFPAVASGRIARQTPLPIPSAYAWQLTGGGLAYIWPDTLLRGEIRFAAVERDKFTVFPFLPNETPRPGNGPLSWQLTPNGMLLKGTTNPLELRSFLHSAAIQLTRLMEGPAEIDALWQLRNQQAEAAQTLSRTKLLDTLQVLLFEDTTTPKPAVPSGFDFIITGDIQPDSLALYMEQYLAGMGGDKHTPLKAVEALPGEGIRKGIGQRVVLYPNPAEENKLARVYTGACPYTLEQFVLMQLLEEIVREATSGTVFVKAALEAQPRGHYYVYCGYSVLAWEAAYNEHLLDQVFVDLAVHGPSESQLKNAQHTLEVRYEEQFHNPDFQQEILLGYSQSGKDFLTGYAERVQQTDAATLRDFVRQILEYGNRAQVDLFGATKKSNGAS